MADKKISALTAATTPLAGTETLPIVQGGATVQVSVTNLTAGRDVAMAGLTTTGNTTLGNATTDTVTANGYMGVGGAASSNVGVFARSAALTTTAQTGIYSALTGSSAATSTIRAFASSPATAAAVFTVSDLMGYWALDASKGAGSTITNQYGIYISNQTQGANNYGVYSAVASAANKWNFYASGTADNYAAGNWKFAAAKGINFTANTPAAGMTSQLLNWYEEGTWTPVITGTITNPTVTYEAGNTGGFYTRVGNVVTITFEVRWSAISGGSGDVLITGFPFPRKTTNLPDGDHFALQSRAVTYTGNTIMGSLTTGGTTMFVETDVSGSTSVAVPISGLGVIGVGFLRGTFSYFI